MKNLLLLLFVVILVLGAATGLYLTLPSDEDESQASKASTIGYVGCSNTWMTVEGYHTAGGDKFWEANQAYGGGNVVAWSSTIETGGRYWDLFDNMLSRHPDTEAIWWELCVRYEDADFPHSAAQDILDAIQARVPDATIYVSAIPGYPDEMCGITHEEGVIRSAELVNELLENNPELKAGPVLEAMTSDKTTADNCHINEASRPLLGQELIGFFD